MPLFAISKKNVTKIPPLKVGLEKDIQRLFEANLPEILNITFLASEHSTSFGGRIDTLGVDNNGSPVIIQYKRNQNESVINQGLSYLKWLLDHKADFQVLLQKNRVSIDIDWDSPRVICVAESYNKFDLDTAELLPFNIELLKYRVYQNNLLLVEPETQQKVRITTPKTFVKKPKVDIGLNVQHTLEDHLKVANQSTRKLFEALKESITALDESIIEEPKKMYIAYKLATNFVDVVVLKDSLKLFLNVASGDLVDPNGVARDLTKPKHVGHWGNGDYEVRIADVKALNAAMDLIKQSYTHNK